MVSELAFARGARIEPHTSPNTAYFIVVEGGGWVGVDGERTRIAAGEAAVWPADIIHSAWTEHSEMRAFVVELTGPDDTAVVSGIARELAADELTSGQGEWRAGAAGRFGSPTAIRAKANPSSRRARAAWREELEEVVDLVGLGQAASDERFATSTIVTEVRAAGRRIARGPRPPRRTMASSWNAGSVDREVERPGRFEPISWRSDARGWRPARSSAGGRCRGPAAERVAAERDRRTAPSPRDRRRSRRQSRARIAEVLVGDRPILVPEQPEGGHDVGIELDLDLGVEGDRLERRRSGRSVNRRRASARSLT